MKNKMVIVCQRDVKDCGVCCLQSIIKYYNGYVPIEKIRLDTYTSMQGVSVYHLLKAAEKYGFDANAIVNMQEVVEYLYNKPYQGQIYIDDTIKTAIDAYYEQYGAK